MQHYEIVVEKEAAKELEKHFKSGNKSVIKKLERIFEDLETHPFEGVGNPEALKYELSGKWSRSINKKDRLVYRVEEDAVEVYILSAIGHYNDK
jgi:toxin YoeB